MALAVKTNPGYERYYDPIRTISTGTSGTENPTDKVIVINVSTAYGLALLPRPWAGRRLCIKDGSGAAAAHNITISTTDTTTIDGSATFILNGNYSSVDLVFNGINWNIV